MVHENLENKPKETSPLQSDKATGIESKLEVLKARFREEFSWNEFLEYHQRFIDQYVSDPAQKKRGLEVINLKDENFESIEMEFVDRVIECYLRWSEEPNPIVLWDCDLTMGGSPQTFYGNNAFLADTGIRWGFRPVQLQLFEFLQREFPNVRNGILSRREEETLLSELEDRSELGAIREYIDLEHIYSVHSDTKKLQKLEELRRDGLSVRSIDDSEDVWEVEAPAGTGLDYTGIALDHWVCVVVGHEYCELGGEITKDSRDSVKAQFQSEIDQNDSLTKATKSFREIQLTGDPAPFTGPSTFDGRQNFIELMKILYAHAEQNGYIDQVEDLDDAIAKAEQQLDTGASSIIARCYNVAGPLEFFVESPDIFPKQGEVGVFEDLASTTYDGFSLKLPRLRLKIDFDFGAEPFYQLCTELANAGVRFVASMDGMEESGLTLFRNTYLTDRPNNFVLD